MSDKNEKQVNAEVEELQDDDLDQVSGGAGMRHVHKEKTVDISEDLMKRI